jgi:serine/threonine-protein kinase
LPYYGTVREAVSALEARQYLELQGQVLLDRYRVEGTLGISTKAGVFKAFDTWLERLVTIKVLSKTMGSHTDRILLDEARTLARLDHANIVSVYDCVKDQDHLYLVREYVEGETLDSWRKRFGHGEFPSPAKVLAIARDILRGLAYAHGHGVIHRYVHPQNVILSHAQAKLMNFGLADRPEETWTLNQVAYMSPEQLTHQKAAASADLYSLGMLLYELLTGRLPFGADTVKDLIEQCIYAPPIPPRKIRAEIPMRLERIVLQLLNKAPISRQPSANAVLEELDSVKVEENPAVRSARHEVETARNR